MLGYAPRVAAFSNAVHHIASLLNHASYALLSPPSVLLPE